MMTLQEAIDHATQKGIQLLETGCDECGMEHMQLADWLRQLQVYYADDNVPNNGWDVATKDEGDSQVSFKLSPNDSILRVRLVETRPFSPSTFSALVRGYREAAKKSQRPFPVITISKDENDGKYMYDMSVVLTDSTNK